MFKLLIFFLVIIIGGFSALAITFLIDTLWDFEYSKTKKRYSDFIKQIEECW